MKQMTRKAPIPTDLLVREFPLSALGLTPSDKEGGL